MAHRHLRYDDCVRDIGSTPGRTVAVDERTAIRMTEDHKVEFFIDGYLALTFDADEVVTTIPIQNITYPRQTRLNWVLHPAGYKLVKRRSDDQWCVADVVSGETGLYRQDMHLRCAQEEPYCERLHGEQIDRS